MGEVFPFSSIGWCDFSGNISLWFFCRFWHSICDKK
jgi:hypothetical protein